MKVSNHHNKRKNFKKKEASSKFQINEKNQKQKEKYT